MKNQSMRQRRRRRRINAIIALIILLFILILANIAGAIIKSWTLSIVIAIVSVIVLINFPWYKFKS